MSSLFETALFWNIFSVAAGFCVTFWILKNPAPFLVLLGLFIGVWFLFGPLGAGGFVAAAAVRMARPGQRASQNPNGKKKRSLKKN